MLKRNAKPSKFNGLTTKYLVPIPAANFIKLLKLGGELQTGKLQWVLVFSLTVAAFFMRRKGLATQSLWFDEADLVSRAASDLPTILQSFFKPGENGPLYTLFMHFWVQAAGMGEGAVRFPSLVAGTLAVPLIFLVARKLGGVKLGLLVSFLLSVSPYHLWYSQDAKMYPLALCFTLASLYLYLQSLEINGKSLWAAFVIVTTLGFYIHLMTILIVGVEVVYFFFTRLSRLQSWFTGPQEVKYRYNKKRAFISLGLLTLPYLPIALWQLVALRDGTVGNGWFQPVGLLDMFNTLGRRFGMNRSIEPWESIGALTFAALACLGLFAVWFSSDRSFVGPKLSTGSNRLTAFFLSVYLLLPVMAFYILTTRLPLFADRYLLVASPAYYILAAWGLLWLMGKLWPAALAAFTLASICIVIALASYNYSSAVQKEDWRGAMHWLAQRVQPGDEVFIIPGYLDSAVKYYFNPSFDVPLISIPGDLLDDHDDIQLNDFLQKSIKGHERAWLVVSPERYKQVDKKEFVRTGWFGYNTFMFSDPEVKVGVTIYGYTFKLIPGTNAEFFPKTGKTSFTFGNSLSLEGYSLNSNNGLPEGTVRYGDFLPLELYWRKTNTDPTNYFVTVRLLDKNGNDTATAYSAQPLNGYYPTGRWHQNEAVRDFRYLYIHVPPGDYKLEISVYPTGNPQNLLTATGPSIAQDTSPSQKVLLSRPIIVRAAS